MVWLASKLKHRIAIQQAVQSDNIDGGFSQTYITLLTVWAGLEAKKSNRIQSFLTEYIKGKQVQKHVTHEFLVRYSAVMTLGRSYSLGFSSGFDSIEDLSPLKSDYFIFFQKGSTVKGRRFRLRRVSVDDNNSELVRIGVEEMEELGTGHSL